MRTKQGAPAMIMSSHLTSQTIARKSAPVQTGIRRRRIQQRRKSVFVNSKGIYHKLPKVVRKAVKSVKIVMTLDTTVPDSTRKNILKATGQDESTGISRKVRSMDDFENFERVDAYIKDMHALLTKNYDSPFFQTPMSREFEGELRKELDRVIGENFDFDPIQRYEVRIPITEPEREE